jgi:hypothetical protein
MYYLMQEGLNAIVALSYERYQNCTRELLKKWHLPPPNILHCYPYPVSPEQVWFILKLIFSTAFTKKCLETCFCGKKVESF